ncbi:MAG: SIR2 family protein [Thermoleophilia bacterium]|nr:SIR2 family protein [Thermoleophilia bacterium]
MSAPAEPPARDLLGGTVTFLFTDVEGSTALLKRLGERYAEALDAHRAIVRTAVEQAGGREIDTQGDAFFVAFARAKDAVNAAVAAQRALAEHRWPDGQAVRVRMGIHTGEPAVGGDRYVGLGVHRAARICAAGHGGQILVSQTSRELLRDDPPDVELRDLGTHRLKDLDQPERLYQVVSAGLSDAFPALSAPSTARWDFRVLGALEVREHGRQVPLGGPRQRAVLALLLLNANRVVPTERLVDQLWGEQPPRTAITSLQNAIAQLRKALGADRLQTRSPGYLLRVDDGEFDLARFERLVRSAREADAAQRARTLREALDLWRGAPLADFAYEAFAQSEIGRLEELRLAALEQRIDAELELGRQAELVGELESLVADHPLRERLRGQLMLALYRSGRQAEALDAYRAARRALTEELGIEPTPSLQRLHSAILRQDADLEAAGAAGVRATDEASEAVRALLAGRLVVVLGAGVNAAGNGDSAPPRPADVAAYLAECFDCPPDEPRELARVAQYVAVTRGTGPLYDELHDLLAAEHPVGPVQRGVVELAAVLRERGAPQLVIVTTNYDLALERALLERGEPFDTLSYVAGGRDRGKFVHVKAEGSVTLVELPNAYAEVPVGRRLVVVKAHGQVDPDPARERESFVISEDDYIGYLAQTDVANALPVTLAAKLRRSHFLFLGYGLRDWTLRVFLQRLWPDERPSYRSWAVDGSVEPVERDFWRHRGVDLVEMELDAYLERLALLLREAPRRGAAA